MGLLDKDDGYVPRFSPKRITNPQPRDNFEELQQLGREEPEDIEA